MRSWKPEKVMALENDPQKSMKNVKIEKVLFDRKIIKNC